MTINELRDSAFERVKTIINLFGPRLVGDESTHKAAEYIENDLKQYCDFTKSETFKCNPRAFLGWVRYSDIIYLIGVICAWFNFPMFGAVFGFLAVLNYVVEDVFFMKFSDPLYKSATGRNVYGIIEPLEETKQTVVFSGHHDSAYIFGFYEFLPNLFLIRAALGLLTPLFLAVGMFIEMYLLYANNQSQFDFFGQTPSFMRKMNIFFAFYTFIAMSSWNFVKDEGTPGAGDNLIASSIGIEIAKHFSKNKLKHTRLVIVSFDGEEAGLRGSRAFWNAHAKEFVNCTNFNVDSPFFLKEFTLLKSDINGFLPLDKQMCDEIVEIGKKNDIKVQQKDLLFLLGGTDAAEAARHGIKATTLIGLPWTVGDYDPVYHTNLDIPENVEPEAVSGVLTLALHYIESKDN